MVDLAKNVAKIDLNGDGNSGGGNETEDYVEIDDYSSLTFDPERALEEARNAQATANLERDEAEAAAAADAAAREEEERIGPVEAARKRAAHEARMAAVRELSSLSKIPKRFPPRTRAEAWLLRHVPPGDIDLERYVSIILGNPEAHSHGRHKSEMKRLEHIPHWEGASEMSRCRYNRIDEFSINHEHCVCKFHENEIYPPLIDRLSR